MTGVNTTDSKSSSKIMRLFFILKFIVARIALRARPIWSPPAVFGLRFRCLLNDAVGRTIYRHGIYEPHILACIQKNIRIERGDLAIDIGANIGWYSCIFSKMLEGRGLVIALEPEPNNFTLLRQNVNFNRLDNVVTLERAISDKKSTVLLHLYKASNRGRHSVLQIHDGPAKAVISSRLDDLLEDFGLQRSAIAILKIDVEGYEAIALRGASRVLERSRLVIVEWSPDYMQRGGVAATELADILLKSGFEIFVIDSAGAAVAIDRDQLLATKNQIDLVCIKTRDEMIDRD
jgi:FkbM family methyltransferase